MKVLIFAVIGTLVASSAAASPKKAPRKVTLHSTNTLVLRAPVTGATTSKLLMELTEKAKAFPPNNEMFLVLDTPGGDVDAGLKFIDALSGFPQKITTITKFAASMGFHIVQGSSERLITQHGVLMSHHAHVTGIDGDVPGNAVTRINHIARTIEISDTEAAKRMHISLKAYKAKIAYEYWSMGEDAVADGAADNIVIVTCSDSLFGTTKEKLDTFFGEVEVEFSNCPMISDPISVKFPDKTAQEKQNLIYQMFNNKESFVQDYIVTGKLSGILR